MSKKKSNKKIYQLYKIEWIDAASSQGWRGLNLPVETICWDVTSVGWLLSKTKDYYVLTMGIGKYAEVSSERFYIPLKWVKKVTKIKGHNIELELT